MSQHSEAVDTAQRTYLAEFEPAEEGGYVVSFPSFPGLVTQGETLDEARGAAADLLGGYLELMRERGRLPPPSDATPTAAIREPLTVTLQTA